MSCRRLSLIKEADRQMTICNACRYCEGYCAVLPGDGAAPDLHGRATCSTWRISASTAGPATTPASSRRRTSSRSTCPQVFAQIRAETYHDYSWPGCCASSFATTGGPSAWITVGCALLILALGAHLPGAGRALRNPCRRGRLLPGRAVRGDGDSAVGHLALRFVGSSRSGRSDFWRETHSSDMVEMVRPSASSVKATRTPSGCATLKGGESGGCNYPDAASRTPGACSTTSRSTASCSIWPRRRSRRSTTTFCIGRRRTPAELPGRAGHGRRRDAADRDGRAALPQVAERPATADGARMREMDVAFLVILFLTSLSGMLLLAFRETAAMGTLLAIHLGIVAGVLHDAVRQVRPRGLSLLGAGAQCA